MNIPILVSAFIVEVHEQLCVPKKARKSVFVNDTCACVFMCECARQVFCIDRNLCACKYQCAWEFVCVCG